MSSTHPIRVTAMHGRINEGSYGKRSKSEREALFIETIDTRYILRRKSGPAFNDTYLRKYLGHEVECDGFVIGTTLLVERIKQID